MKSMIERMLMEHNKHYNVESIEDSELKCVKEDLPKIERSLKSPKI